MEIRKDKMARILDLFAQGKTKEEIRIEVGTSLNYINVVTKPMRDVMRQNGIKLPPGW